MNPNNISIRKMQHADLEIMARWLSTKEVLEFYGDINSPFTLDQVTRKYGARIDGDVPIAPFIVELKGASIGFMQHYKIEEEQQQKFGYPANSTIYGIDQFIGVPTLFNKGLGTIMVRKFIASIFLNTDAEVIILDTSVSNVRAIKCYEKCGFEKVKKINNESSWLMEINNSTLSNIY